MKKIIQKIKNFYHYKDVSFYVSLLGPLTMGTIHLISLIIKFDNILLCYCLFSYLLVFLKVWQWAIDKFKIKPNNYIAGIISIILLLTPMMSSFILTILYKDAPNYIFNWLIYAYALYGTIKLVFSIISISKKEKTDKKYVLSYVGLLSALYTIQMMEFNLIMTFSDKENQAMYMILLFTQGFIFLFSLFVIGLFVRKLIIKKKENK